MPVLDDTAATIVVASLKASTAQITATQPADETRTIEVSFTPTKPSNWFSQEVYGTISLTETCYGAVENIDGTRVQHTHDRALYRLMEELVNELRELRNSE